MFFVAIPLSPFSDFSVIRLTGIFIYPVKALRGFAVDSAEVDALGMVGDRRFLVVDETGRFLTQRTIPRMALIATALSPNALTLSAEGSGAVSVPRASDPAAPLRTVSVWKSEGLVAEDCGPDVAAWLTAFLGVRCGLVRIGEKFLRPVTKSAARPGDIVTFADSCPFLVISQASLADLNDRLVAQGEETLPMDRFRPNFVIEGCAPFAEDTWPRVRIGALAFRTAGPCVRCIVPTIDQETAERGKEPLRTLATYRRSPNDPTGVIFGNNLIHDSKSGPIRTGDLVEPLE